IDLMADGNFRLDERLMQQMLDPSISHEQAGRALAERVNACVFMPVEENKNLVPFFRLACFARRNNLKTVFTKCMNFLENPPYPVDLAERCHIFTIPVIYLNTQCATAKEMDFIFEFIRRGSIRIDYLEKQISLLKPPHRAAFYAHCLEEGKLLSQPVDPKYLKVLTALPENVVAKTPFEPGKIDELTRIFIRFKANDLKERAPRVYERLLQDVPHYLTFLDKLSPFDFYEVVTVYSLALEMGIIKEKG